MYLTPLSTLSQLTPTYPTDCTLDTSSFKKSLLTFPLSLLVSLGLLACEWGMQVSTPWCCSRDGTCDMCSVEAFQ